MSNFKKLSSDDRRELFDQYKKLQECEYEIGYLIKNTRGWQAAKSAEQLTGSIVECARYGMKY